MASSRAGAPDQRVDPRAAARPIAPLQRTARGADDGHRVVTAQLHLTPAAMMRLLAVTGRQSEFILSAVDGRTTVRVAMTITAVPDSQLAVGRSGVLLDWSRSELTWHGTRVALTRMELRTLLALLEYAPEPAPYDAIIERLWEVCPGAPRARSCMAALPVWICALRRRLRQLGRGSAIRTVRGVGYALTL